MKHESKVERPYRHFCGHKSNRLIGWVYESNRTSQKEAQNDLDSFLNEDRINDLTGTKDAELSILQEQLDAWDKYLEQLEWDMNEHERI